MITTGNTILFSQELFEFGNEAIEAEINTVFEKSILAAETLDVNSLTESIDDTFKNGFIGNGSYFNTFEKMLPVFKAGIKGLESQKM